MLIREKIEQAIKKKYTPGEVLTCGEIIDCVCTEYKDTNPESVIPSDYCNNLRNKTPYSGKYHFFEYLARNKYKVLIGCC